MPCFESPPPARGAPEKNLATALSHLFLYIEYTKASKERIQPCLTVQNVSSLLISFSLCAGRILTEVSTFVH